MIHAVDEVGHDASRTDPGEMCDAPIYVQRRLSNQGAEISIGESFREPLKSQLPVESQTENYNKNKKPPTCVGKMFHFFRSVIPYGGLLSSSFNLASATLGAGIISLPSAFNLSGIAMATLYLILVSIGTVYSMNLLAKLILKTGVRSYGEASKKLLGRGSDYFLAVLMIFLCFGGSVAYVIAVGTLLKPVLASPSVPPCLRTANGLRIATVLVWFFCMLPLLIPKRINSLRHASTIGVFFILYFVICIVVHSAERLKNHGVPVDIEYAKLGNGAVSGFSLFMFSLMCQMNAFEIFGEMKEKTVFHFTLYTTISVCACSSLYFLGGLFGYLAWGTEVTDSVLSLYDPVNNLMFAVGYVGIVVKLCVAFSLHLIPLREALYHLLNWEAATVPYWKHSLVSVTPAFLALLCGLFIPKINSVLGLLGAFCGGTIGIIFPALFFMYSGGFTIQKIGWVNYCATYILLCAGVVAVVFGTGSTIYSSII